MNKQTTTTTTTTTTTSAALATYRKEQGAALASACKASALATHKANEIVSSSSELFNLRASVGLGIDRWIEAADVLAECHAFLIEIMTSGDDPLCGLADYVTIARSVGIEIAISMEG